MSFESDHWIIVHKNFERIVWPFSPLSLPLSQKKIIVFWVIKHTVLNFDKKKKKEIPGRDSSLPINFSIPHLLQCFLTLFSFSLPLPLFFLLSLSLFAIFFWHIKRSVSLLILCKCSANCFWFPLNYPKLHFRLIIIYNENKLYFLSFWFSPAETNPKFFFLISTASEDFN